MPEERKEGRKEGRKEERMEGGCRKEGKRKDVLPPAWRGTFYPSHPCRVAPTIDCTVFSYGEIRSLFISLSSGDEGSVDEKRGGKLGNRKGGKEDDGKKTTEGRKEDDEGLLFLHLSLP
jgi:hypothetical protein